LVIQDKEKYLWAHSDAANLLITAFENHDGALRVWKEDVTTGKPMLSESGMGEAIQMLKFVERYDKWHFRHAKTKIFFEKKEIVNFLDTMGILHAIDRRIGPDCYERISKLDKRYITLPELLENLADTFPPKEYQDKKRDSDIEKYWKEHHSALDQLRRESEAAQALREKIDSRSDLHAQILPRWLQFDDGTLTVYAVEDSLLEIDGIKYLTERVKEFEEQNKKILRHIRSCRESGHDLWTSSTSANEVGNATEWLRYRYHISRICFARLEIISFLDDNGITHTLGNDQEWRWQEIASHLKVSKKTAQNMNKETGKKYITLPCIGGRNSHCFTTNTKLDRMNEEYQELKKQRKDEKKQLA
jgi:hypothetical protein